MKIIHRLSSVLVVLGLLLVFPAQAFAGGGAPSVLKLTSSAASVTVGKSVTVYLYAYQYACQEGATLGVKTQPFTCGDGSQSYEYPTAGDYFWFTITGSGNTTSGLTTQDGHDAIKTGADGKAQFTLSSTNAETKSITVAHENGFFDDQNKTITITFKNAVTTSSTPKAAPVAEVPAPEAPKASVEVQGKTNTDATVELRNKQPLVLNGTTVANGTVTLYIFSEPKKATVTADTSGHWTYTVSDLEPGSHHVEAEVTDPATGKTSARVTLATFTVAKPVNAPVAEKVAAPSSTNTWLLLAAIVAVVLAAGGGLWWWLTKRSKHATPAPMPPTDTPDKPIL